MHHAGLAQHVPPSVAVLEIERECPGLRQSAALAIPLGARRIAAGDLVAFDTDLIGPGGCHTDISRSRVVGDRRPSDAQRRLYDRSRRQLDHKVALLRPGPSFREYGERAVPLSATPLEEDKA